MAICAAIDASGFIVQQATTALNACTGFVLLDKADFVQYGLVQSLITMPTTADAQLAWFLGFATPVTLGLYSYCVGKLVSMWNDRHH